MEPNKNTGAEKEPSYTEEDFITAPPPITEVTTDDQVIDMYRDSSQRTLDYKINITPHCNINVRDNVILIDMQSSTSFKNSSGTWNSQDHRALICNEIRNFHLHITDAQVLIVTDYPASARRLHQQLSEKDDWYKDHVRVRTADTAEGDEAEIVFLSFDRTRGIGIQGDANRVCVGTTRAIHAMVIVADTGSMMRGIERPGRHRTSKHAQALFQACRKPSATYIAQGASQSTTYIGTVQIKFAIAAMVTRISTPHWISERGLSLLIVVSLHRRLQSSCRSGLGRHHRCKHCSCTSWPEHRRRRWTPQEAAAIRSHPTAPNAIAATNWDTRRPIAQFPGAMQHSQDQRSCSTRLPGQAPKSPWALWE